MKQLAWSVRFAVSLMLCAGAYAQSGGLRFTLTDLGTFGGTAAYAYGINDNGQVVGGYTVGSSNYKCFLYSPGLGSNTWVSPYPNGYCFAGKINSAGVIAGTITGSNGYYSAFTATRKDASTMRIVYKRSSYGLATYATSIDEDSNVGGTIDTPTSYRAAFWWPGSNPAGEVAGDFSLGTVAIWNGDFDGESVFYMIGGRAYNHQHGWEYELPHLGTTVVSSYVSAGPEYGFEAVGWSYADDVHQHAALWDYRGCDSYSGWCVHDLGFSGSDSAATGISYSWDQSGWIIGWFQNPTTPFLRVDDPHCPVPVDLNSLLDSSGKKWHVTQANGINATHQIAGAATFNGVTHAVLLTPANNLPLCL